jgi:hypothetical protein
VSLLSQVLFLGSIGIADRTPSQVVDFQVYFAYFHFLNKGNAKKPSEKSGQNLASVYSDAQ